METNTTTQEILAPDTAPASLPVAAPRATLPATSTTPDALIQLAMQTGADLDRLERLMEMKERYERAEAQKAFTEAMVAFKAENIVVKKDRDNLQFGSRYTSLGVLVNTVTPFLSKHGLSADWDLDQADGITVICTLTHRLGGFKSVRFSGPKDTSGKKNDLQQIKSTVTYLKSVTYESVCGIATTDANMDDDGNGAGDDTPTKSLSEIWCGKAVAAPTLGELQKVWEAGVAHIERAQDREAYEQFKGACNTRKHEIEKAQANRQPNTSSRLSGMVNKGGQP